MGHVLVLVLILNVLRFNVLYDYILVLSQYMV